MPSHPRSPKTDLECAFGRCRAIFIAVLLLSMIINLLLFTPALYMLQVYDRVLATQSGETLGMLTLMAAVALVVMAVVESIRARLLVRAGIRLDALLSNRMFAAIFRDAVGRHKTGGTQLLSDLDGLRDFLSGGALLTFCDVPWVPLFIIIMFLFHPLLGLVSSAGAVALVGLALANELAVRPLLREAARRATEAYGFAEASLRDADALSAMGMMPSVRRRWLSRHTDMLGLQAQAMDRGGRLMAVGKPLRLALQITLLGTGAWLAIDRQITPGAMVAASIIMSRALAPVEMAVGQWKGFLQARAVYARLRALLQAVPPEPQRLALPQPAGRLALERVVAKPPGARAPVLKAVTFRLAPGEVLGVVGPSGSGKSTLARVLTGIWPIAEGRLQLDGADLSQWSPEALGPHLGYLPQDVHLFDGTVAENIARLATGFDAARVVRAAQRAGVHELILRLPQGYDTWIGAGGLILSGGQRQRVGLARALYGDPPVLVLDEPNASLDDEGETALIEALRGLKCHGHTVIAITHRMRLLVAVDKILVLRDGKVTAFGERDVVMAGLDLDQTLDRATGRSDGRPAEADGTIPSRSPGGRGRALQHG